MAACERLLAEGVGGRYGAFCAAAACGKVAVCRLFWRRQLVGDHGMFEFAEAACRQGHLSLL